MIRLKLWKLPPQDLRLFFILLLSEALGFCLRSFLTENFVGKLKICQSTVELFLLYYEQNSFTYCLNSCQSCLCCHKVQDIGLQFTFAMDRGERNFILNVWMCIHSAVNFYAQEFEGHNFQVSSEMGFNWSSASITYHLPSYPLAITGLLTD